MKLKRPYPPEYCTECAKPSVAVCEHGSGYCQKHLDESVKGGMVCKTRSLKEYKKYKNLIDWRKEVANGITLLGLDEWVEQKES